MATAGRPPALPAFSAREALARKAADANVLLFGVPAGSSLLLPLLRPPCHAYAPRDDRWLQAMRAAQTVPSRRLEALRDAVQRVLTCAVPPVLGQKLEKTLRPLLGALEAKGTAKGDDLANPSPERLVVGLQIKDRIAALLREWTADPVEGFVLRKDHVVAGLRRDDLVATPAGAGYLRAYRPKDGFCTVVYPWGHGLIHLTQVEKADVALRSQLHKRKANEFVPLEHQHLFEQVERLPSNVSSEEAIQDVEGQDESGAVELTGIDVEQYRALLDSLDEDADTAETSAEQSFVRRVQALAAKTRELQMSKRQRLEDEEDQPEGDDQGEDEEDDGELAREEVETKRRGESMDVNEQQQGEELQPPQQALPVEG